MRKKYTSTPFNRFLVKWIPIFDTSLFLSICIGLPFCIFKAIFGLLVYRNVSTHAGIAVLVWAGIDILMNLLRTSFDFFKKETPIEFCLLSQIGRYFERTSIFLAIDTFLSFSIICGVLWAGWITQLSSGELFYWYLATTVNMLSLSLVNIMKQIAENSE